MNAPFPAPARRFATQQHGKAGPFDLAPVTISLMPVPPKPTPAQRPARSHPLNPDRPTTRDPAGVAISVVVGALIVFIGISALTRVFSGDNVDFLCFFAGASAMAEGRNPYAERVMDNFGYIYPPLLGVLLMPLVPLGVKAASVIWLILIWTLIPLTAWLTADEFRRRLTTAGAAPWARATVASVAALGVLVVLDKLHHEVRLGNSNLITVLAFVLALRWLGPRPLLAGLVLGLAANIKYLPIVVLPYLLVRGQFRASAGMVVGALAGALLPALVLGWSTNLDYLATSFGAVGELSASTDQATVGPPVFPITWNYSVSISSALARTLGTGPGLWIAIGAVAAALLGFGWALYRANGIPLFQNRTRTAETTRPGRFLLSGLELLGLIGAALVFSPQSSSRHFNMALPLAVAAVALAVAGLRGRAEHPALGHPPLHRTRRVAVIVGTVVFGLSMILPPGAGALHAFVQPWRDLAGISLGLLAMLFAAVWRGLDIARALDAQPKATTPVTTPAKPPAHE